MSQGLPTPIRGQKSPQPPDYSELAAFAALIPPPEVHVRFPWRDLDGIYGPLLPGSVHILSARTGSGKTLFVLNWIWSLISANPHTGVGYFPLETPAREVLARLACHTLGVHPASVLRGDFSTIPDGEKGFRAQCEVLAEHFLKPRVWPGFAAMAPKLWLWDEPTISVERIRLAVLEAAEAGCRVVVVDHLLRLELGDGSNLYAEVSKAIRALKMLAEEAQVVMIVTSQQSRATGGNRLAWYAPPDLQALKGAGTIEEEADGVLFLHRVLKDTISPKDKVGVENGIVALQDVVASDIMGCAIGKHRLDGGQVGAACRLFVDRGLVADLPDHVRREWEAAKNSIATQSKVY